MTAEVFVQAEGQLSWVSASGNSNAWATAASSPSGVAIAFVTEFSMTSAQTITTISDRGTPNHQKRTSREAPTVSFTVQWSGEEGIPDYPVHLEWKGDKPDGSAFYQFHRAMRTTRTLTEAMEGNTMADQFNLLGLNGPTASGYLG